MTAPFLGQVPNFETDIDDPGFCRFGGGNECAEPAEVQVVLPDLASERLLCRGHVGHYMLAGTTNGRFGHVLVRRLAPLVGVGPPTLVRVREAS